MGFEIRNGILVKYKPGLIGEEEVIVPDWVTSIGVGAFQDCKKLKKVTLSPKVTRIGPAAFSGCRSLVRVLDCDNLVIIDDSAFHDCESLLFLPGGNKVRYIGREAFYRCKSLEHVALPESVNHLGNAAFSECSALSTLSLPWTLEKLETIDGLVPQISGCDKLRELIIYSDGEFISMHKGVELKRDSYMTFKIPGCLDDKIYQKCREKAREMFEPAGDKKDPEPVPAPDADTNDESIGRWLSGTTHRPAQPPVNTSEPEKTASPAPAKEVKGTVPLAGDLYKTEAPKAPPRDDLAEKVAALTARLEEQERRQKELEDKLKAQDVSLQLTTMTFRLRAQDSRIGELEKKLEERTRQLAVLMTRGTEVVTFYRLSDEELERMSVIM